MNTATTDARTLPAAIEQVLGVVLPTRFVPRGRYHNVNACVTELMVQTRAVRVHVVKKIEEHHV